MEEWTTGGMDRPFIRQSGSTLSSGTGPSAAAVGNFYVYAETSYGNLNLKFDLQRVVSGGHHLYGISFQYHKYGATIGSAVLESSADGAIWM